MKSLNILITGGASGIGLGIAEYLGQAGNHIVLADIDLTAAAKASQDLAGKGIRVTPLQLDVGNAEQIEGIAMQLAPMTIDVLINNAGIQHVARLEEFPAQKWQSIVDIMLVGPALLSKAFLPSMREKNFGRIINIGSIHALVASPYKTAYVAAKHGLIGFAKALALETGDCNVTVNTICPSYVKTPMVEKQITAQAKENGISEQEVVDKIMLAPMPKKAFIEIDELASSAAFLISDAARNMTAQTIVLDGGWTAR